jgi:hypothetical protein
MAVSVGSRMHSIHYTFAWVLYVGMNQQFKIHEESEIMLWTNFSRNSITTVAVLGIQFLKLGDKTQGTVG